MDTQDRALEMLVAAHNGDNDKIDQIRGLLIREVNALLDDIDGASNGEVLCAIAQTLCSHIRTQPDPNNIAFAFFGTVAYMIPLMLMDANKEGVVYPDKQLEYMSRKALHQALGMEEGEVNGRTVN